MFSKDDFADFVAQTSFIHITIRARKQEAPAGKVSKQQLVATTAAVALAAANPAHAGDLFGPEYAGAVGNVALFLGVGIGAISALFLPIICGTLNPVQIAINLSLIHI